MPFASFLFREDPGELLQCSKYEVQEHMLFSVVSVYCNEHVNVCAALHVVRNQTVVSDTAVESV